MDAVIHVLRKPVEIAVLGHLSNGFYYIKSNDLTGYVMEEYLNVTDEAANLETEIRQVGQTFDGYSIYSYTAPNGQLLYFSGLEDPWVTFEDVNFDSHKDIVITIIRGASNFFTEFFVWQNGEYVYAPHDGLDYGLCNYQLYPEHGLVFSGANNGGAGAEHEDVLFRWEGNKLKAIRRAVSETHSATTHSIAGTEYTTTSYLQQLRVRVWDYSRSIYEGELIYDDVINLQQLNDSEDYRRLFAGEQEAFWRGIR